MAHRRYIDPQHWIYLDEDDDVHFDGPAIARFLEVPLEEAMKMVRAILVAQGIEVRVLDHPDDKPRRGN